ncbi:MAG: hypothetical protein E3J21_19865 [Anaerolineales bacterium]|nr:MAG: hypothetical protein E3J21_19865 [Anaerolineales bacterium]
MSLDPLRQTTFDVLCHCFDGLLAYCEPFEQAISTQSWSLVQLAQECFDPAANKFGRTSKSTDPIEALTDLLDLMTNAVEGQRPKNRELVAACDTYYKTVIELLLVPLDLSGPQSVGEELSRAFYTRLGGPGDHLQRPVHLEVELDHQLGVCCLPEKQGKVSSLTFLFAPAAFCFSDFLNLPFYFLHEYLSHLHTAPMYADQFRKPHVFQGSFEDGWLIYTAFDLYWERLNEPTFLGHEAVRSEALDHYITVTKQEPDNHLMEKGYDLAKWFHMQVLDRDPEAFRYLSAQLALRPFDHLGAADLHTEFVREIARYRRRDDVVGLQQLVQANPTIDELLVSLI